MIITLLLYRLLYFKIVKEHRFICKCVGCTFLSLIYFIHLRTIILLDKVICYSKMQYFLESSWSQNLSPLMGVKASYEVGLKSTQV
jgi:hypothetical protein